jgi:hypothetical protein
MHRLINRKRAWANASEIIGGWIHWRRTRSDAVANGAARSIRPRR